MDIINILDVKINTLTKEQALTKIEEFLADGKQHFIVTPNPEIILAANKDKEFFDILNKADLALPDGIGLKMAVWFKGKNLTRITGADLLMDILDLAQRLNKRVAVFIWQGGLSSERDIRRALENGYPKLQAMVIGAERRTILPERILAPAREFAPDIIFSTLGAPYQEKFIFHNLTKLPSAKIGLGVGGAFDFLTRRIKRAPEIFRNMGLEWLWRLIKQPRRWRRIYHAIIVFPFRFLLNKK